MSSNSHSKTCKLPIVGSDLLCIVNSEWSSNCVKLLLLHDNHAWRGKVVEDEDMTDLLDQLSMTEDEYFEETKKALTTHGGAEHFSYTIDCDNFTWKKSITKDMAIKFGYISLEKAPAFSVFDEIIDKTVLENLELNTKLQRAAQQNITFTEENEHLKSKLNDLLEKKCEMESSLYSQFVYLLNEKKRRISELQKQFQPSCEEENEQGLHQSDSDPFGSDTELDSEDEKQTSAKQGSRDCVPAGERNVCILPKRLKTPTKIESVAGPSGVCNKSRDNQKASINKKSPPNKLQTNTKTTKKPQGKGKKLQKFSCVLGEISDTKQQSSSEEDVFMFPKRSKKISSGEDLVKPSISKIKYDSDDEMPLYKTQRTETDSDNIPSGIDPIDVIETITVQNAKGNNSESVNTYHDQRNGVSKSEKHSDDDSTKGERLETVKGRSFKDFSNSTLQILNQLV